MSLKLSAAVDIAKLTDEIQIAVEANDGIFRDLHHDALMTRDVAEIGAMAAAHVNGKAADFDLSQLNATEQPLLLNAIEEAIGDHFTLIVTGDFLHIEVT